MSRFESFNKKWIGAVLFMVAIPALNGCSTVSGTVNLLSLGLTLNRSLILPSQPTPSTVTVFPPPHPLYACCR